jgi:hypothetical protein
MVLTSRTADTLGWIIYDVQEIGILAGSLDIWLFRAIILERISTSESGS